jgi:hypothetical protein
LKGGGDGANANDSKAIVVFFSDTFAFVPHPRTIPEIEKVLEELRKLVLYYKVTKTMLFIIEKKLRFFVKLSRKINFQNQGRWSAKFVG